jgi:hypothetical protein
MMARGESSNGETRALRLIGNSPAKRDVATSGRLPCLPEPFPKARRVKFGRLGWWNQGLNRGRNRWRNGRRIRLSGLRQGGHITIHGFRSTFRDWVGEETDFDGEAAEFCLAHVKRGTEGAYRRQESAEKRRRIMQAGANRSLRGSALKFRSMSAGSGRTVSGEKCHDLKDCAQVGNGVYRKANRSLSLSHAEASSPCRITVIENPCDNRAREWPDRDLTVRFCGTVMRQCRACGSRCR